MLRTRRLREVEVMAASTAKLSNHVGPQARLVADLIRGKDVAEALSILQFSTKRCARPPQSWFNQQLRTQTSKAGERR